MVGTTPPITITWKSVLLKQNEILNTIPMPTQQKLSQMLGELLKHRYYIHTIIIGHQVLLLQGNIMHMENNYLPSCFNLHTAMLVFHRHVQLVTLAIG